MAPHPQPPRGAREPGDPRHTPRRFGEPPAEANGNLLLDQLLGAELVYTPSKDSEETDRRVEEVSRGYRAKGRPPYDIGRGGSSPRSPPNDHTSSATLTTSPPRCEACQ